MNRQITRYRYFPCTVGLFTLILSCQGITNALRPLLISEDDEIKLGNSFKAQILSDTREYPQYNGNQAVIRFVDSVGKYLASVQDERPNLPFTFTILDKDEINAFAIPGGHIFVYTGLLRNIESTSELAGVLAHEIAHITLYHGVNKMVQGEALNLVNTILFGSDSSSIAGAIANLVESLAFLKLSKNDEYDADKYSVRYTTDAGINPAGMKHFLKFLLDKYGEEPKIFEPLSTHPRTSERINAIEKEISRTPGAPKDDTSLLYKEEYQKIKGLI